MAMLLQGHLTKQLTTSGISPIVQVCFEHGFKEVHLVGQSNSRRKFVPASRTGDQESTIAETHPHPPHTQSSPHRRSEPEPRHGGMSLSAAIVEVLGHSSVKRFKDKQSGMEQAANVGHHRGAA